jgi:hypothetical protein
MQSSKTKGKEEEEEQPKGKQKKASKKKETEEGEDEPMKGTKLKKEKEEEDEPMQEAEEQSKGTKKKGSKKEKDEEDEAMTDTKQKKGSKKKKEKEEDEEMKEPKQKKGSKKREKGEDEDTKSMDAEEPSAGQKKKTKVQVEGFEASMIERGLVDFFFRPKIGVKDPKSLDDVQRFYMLLRPTESESKGKHKARLMLMGAKTMPVPSGSLKERLHWGFVYATAADPEKVTQHLAPKEYDTKTRGQRQVGGAFVVGEGVYEIVALSQPGRPKKKGSGNTQPKTEAVFTYVLEIPEEPGPMQQMLNIKKEDVCLVRVKNPKKPNVTREGQKVGLQPSKAHPESGAKFPEELSKRFAGKRTDQTKFAALDTTDFLDHERTECLFISSNKEITDKLGKIGKELEEFEHLMELDDESKYGKAHMEDKIYEALGMDQKTNPLAMG